MTKPFFISRSMPDHSASVFSKDQRIAKCSAILALNFVAFLVLISSAAHAAIQIPPNLNYDDRNEALRILGFGTSSKLLSDPYPLGGYSGFEIGISMENLPVDELGRLGDGLATPQQDVTYPKFSIAKGLFNNVDLFFQFTPYTEEQELSQFGGLVRWTFYQATFLPISISTMVHMNNANIGNLVTSRSYGVDLIGGINVENIALFVGGGMIDATGTFMGGAGGVTGGATVASASANGFHTVIGATLHISKLFLSAQIDRYTIPVISGKIGLRF